MQQVTILGATGSIGRSTLQVLALHPERYQVFALTAMSRLVELEALCHQYRPVFAVVKDKNTATDLQERLRQTGLKTRVLIGTAGLSEVASHPLVDIVVAAIVGAAGLLPTLAAVRAGKRVLLANKEALVMSGALFMQAVRDSGSLLLPVDSEHNAIFQCLPKGDAYAPAVGVAHIMLTASGGPFRELPLDALRSVSPEQACAHPNWSMGRKISVDSASMMNKGLELIEACWLFDLPPQQVEVVNHPESIVHSLVAYVDGSVLAQLGNPDMRTPIAHALAWPERIDSGVARLDLCALARLHFTAPDLQRFPCLSLARQAAETGGSAPTILNAANEVAVHAFLEGRIRFTDLSRLIADVLDKEVNTLCTHLDEVLAVDQLARDQAYAWLHRYAA